MSIQTMRDALIAAYSCGYITFDEAAPIADYIAELDSTQAGFIPF